MRLRKEIRSLAPGELMSLRRALETYMSRQGPGGFVHLAGFHGIPDWLCPHGSPLFLPWHRAYLRVFEEELQAIDPGVSLPYWDWTSSASFAAGMAPAHTDPTYSDGVAKPNPLASGPTEKGVARTHRVSPHQASQLRSFAASVDLAMKKSTYLDFNSWLEGPHGSVHTWVGGAGGEMSGVARAAFDPIFWSHHANVDRQWAVWQVCNPNGAPAPDLMAAPLPGFPGWTVADTLDLASARLQYTYEGMDQLVCPAPASVTPEGLVPFSLRPSLARSKGPRVVMEVSDVERGGESFSVEVFVRDSADGGAAERVAGAFGIFGAKGIHDTPHGGHHGASPGMTSVQRVDITDAVEELRTRGRNFEVRLRGFDNRGVEVSPSDLPIGTIRFFEM